MTTPSIIDLLTEALQRAATGDQSTQPEKTSRFPIVVNKETREFLEAQARAMGGSLAGLCGTILNEVVIETKRRAQLEIERK